MKTYTRVAINLFYGCFHYLALRTALEFIIHTSVYCSSLRDMKMFAFIVYVTLMQFCGLVVWRQPIIYYCCKAKFLFYSTIRCNGNIFVILARTSHEKLFLIWKILWQFIILCDLFIFDSIFLILFEILHRRLKRCEFFVYIIYPSYVQPL